MTLRPGTVIITGTPEGVGFAREEPIFLREGDEIEIKIEGIGSLKNKVIKEKYFLK
jgi:2-keto-4-pentenoate hydratase/2-oxohepta-3-ene-1,7-dioic acid hydratase in catechol pathway